MQQPLVPTSIGELIDKITILQIKREKIQNETKLENIKRELDELLTVWQRIKDPSVDVSDLHNSLKAVNEKLWEIEDRIRIKEAKAQFDQEFIDLARSVYVQNDSRAGLKKDINIRTGSMLIEEKQYQDY